MKHGKKFVNMLIIGMLLTTTILVYNPIENVKAVPEEADLDTDFIWEVLQGLTNIKPSVDSDYFKGREFGSEGEWAAATFLEDKWNAKIVGDGISVDQEKIEDLKDKWKIKLEEDYDLFINGDKIDEQSYFPNWIEGIRFDNTGEQDNPFTVVKTPDKWYNIVNDQYILNNFYEDLKNEKLSYDIEYVFLNNIEDLSGEIVYIEDYETASLNETEGKIHLIEIPQDNADEAFDDAVQKVDESNGSAFIAMVTNSVFLKQKDTEIPGAAISRLDGEKIKQSLKENDKVYLEMDDEDLPVKGSFNIFCDRDFSETTIHIYLIDQNKVNKRFYSDIVDFVYKKSMEKGSNKPAKAYLVYDRSYEGDEDTGDTHLMSFSWKKKIPGFSIDRTLGKSIEKNDEVKFKIITSKTSITSYNVIGIIPAEFNPSEAPTVIIGGHYDSMWCQGAMDNAVSPSIAWGIAKYFSDNKALIKPKYNLVFVAFGHEESGKGGSKDYAKNFGGDNDKAVAIINMDALCQNSYKNGNRYPNLTPYIWSWELRGNPYSKIWNVFKQSGYTDKTGVPIVTPNLLNGLIRPCPFSDGAPFEHKAIYQVGLHRMPLEKDLDNDAQVLSYFDHRSGEDFTTGDVLSKVYRDDLNATAELVVDLVKLFAVSGDLVFENVCSYTQLDLDSDGNYDSVKVDFDVISNFSESGLVESVIYKNGIPQTYPFKTDLFSIEQNVTTSSNVTVTLLPNATTGNCDIRVYLKDSNCSQNDYDNTTLYLYPYNHSIADFTWELNDNNQKMVNFTDKSMPSPNAVINSWNWSFDDGNFSTLQNCSHNYSNVGIFNVTLTITDSANKTANVTKQVETYNSNPFASYTVNSTLVMVNNSLTFNSTSSDIDGSIVNCTWYFGDNTTGFGPNITHTYTKSGFYTVSLEVTDNDNSSTGVIKEKHILVVDAMVDDGYIDNPSVHKWNSIQEGINDISNNDTIYVYNGSYNPYLVNKSISIYGENKNGVSINAIGVGIDVQSDDIVIKNFTIAGGTTGVKITSTVNGTGNIIIENGVIPGPIIYGVYIDNSSNNTIKSCEIDRADAGIKICNGAKYNVIDDCEIESCYNGVGIYDSSYNWVGNPSIFDWYPNDCTFKLNTNAIYLDESDHNYILGCDIDAYSPLPFGTYRGIYLDEASNTTISTCDIYKGTQGVYIKDSVDSKIEFCRIKENQMGVEFFGIFAKDNLIVQNNITGNIQFGVFIPPDPSNNSIYYNDFIGNVAGPANQSHDDRSSGLMNIWEKTGNRTLTKTGNGEGNYWADYTGSDLDLDGIGDTPYDLDTMTRGTKDDGYPLMATYGWCTGTGWD